MEIEIKSVKLSEINPNPDNPRQISKTDMDRLLKSLQEFPEMLKIREIVVDENMVILGGNMRYRVLKAQKVKDCEIKQVVGLTEAQKKEFIIKDNSAFGQWDFDALANGWDDLPLVDWGVDLPGDWLQNEDNQNGGEGGQADNINSLFNIVITDLDENGQTKLLAEFNERGLKCRALIL